MPPAAEYAQHWNEKFSTRAWGRWPPEDFVRFMGRNFRHVGDKSRVSVLDVGCGPGANAWFLHREGYAVSGIDISPAAIDIARERIARENKDSTAPAPDLHVGNFARLPWPDASFDVAADIFALYANTLPVIDSALAEIARVLKRGGLFYSKLWGRRCTGYGTGTEIEPGTYDAIEAGPCAGMGLAHFFSREEIARVFGRHFTPVAVDTVFRTDEAARQQIEEFHCQWRKT